MDEMSPLLPPNLDAALETFYIAPQPDPAFAARLARQLRQRQIQINSSSEKSPPSFSNRRKTFTQTLRTRPALALLVTFLALLALTGIAYALGRMTGFIPGFGFTSDGGAVFVLAEPVEGTAGGLRLRLDQAVSDSDRFWVELTAYNLAESTDFSRAFLLLPGGEKIQFQHGGRSGPEGGETKLNYLFPPISRATRELTLLVEGLDGQDFSLPLKLRPVEAGELVPALPEGEAQLQSESHAGVRLSLDQVAVDSSKTILQVSLRYDQPNTWVSGPWNVTLSDASGSLYPLKDVTPDTMDIGKTHVYETMPFSGAEQLALRLVSFPSGDTLPMMQDFSVNGPSFSFDPGANPASGQTRELDQPLSAGAFDLKVVSAALTNGRDLVFEVESDPGVSGVMFYSPDPLVSGASGGVPSHSGNLAANLTFSRVPDHPFEVRLTHIYYEAKGPWIIHWQPPAAPTPAAEDATPTAAPTLTPQPTPTQAISDPILLEVQQLAQKFDAIFQQGPGWVHIVRENTTQPREGQVFPPPYYKDEQWFEVDTEGYVTRSVSLDYDEGGQIIQQAATVGNYGVNFTYGESGFNPYPRYRISLDRLTPVLSRAAQSDRAHLTREETVCDNGNPCLLITGWETLSSPSQNPGESQAFSGAGRRVWIDLESGQQVKEQIFHLLADGSEAIDSTSICILAEKVASPPQEILDILGRVITP